MKIIAILPAYNAQKTITSFVRSIPKGIFHEIIIIDDSSKDDTYRIACSLSGVKVYQTPHNLGYGGNLKMCLGVALEHGADVIMELHPDGEYGIDGIVPAIEKVREGAHLVLGNRFDGYPKGMYWQKYIASRLLSWLDNLILGTQIPDMHQGFRVYTRKALETVDYRSFADDYLFSFQIVAAAVRHEMRIDSVPVTAQYVGKKRGASWRASVRYTIGTFSVLGGFVFGTNAKRLDLEKQHVSCPVCHQWYLVAHRLHLGKFTLWFCHACQIGFTYPQPHDIGAYYEHDYWYAPGILGSLKALVFRLAQKRRIYWILQYFKKGTILDVGAGMGIFGRDLTRFGFNITSIDTPYAKLNDPTIQLVDFIKWKTSKRFDAVVFWESFEHIPDPVAYVTKAKNLLKPNGRLFIEYPRYGCVESDLFGRYWYDLDIPRHLFHFSFNGMDQLLLHQGLKRVHHKGIMAFDYAPWGFAQSLMSFILREPPFLHRRDMSLTRLFLLLPFLFVGEILEVALFLCGQSPIQFVVAKKS
jgi:glycosyltransferase involved in cell wall biosynthesis